MIRIQAVYTGLEGMPAVNSFYFAGDSQGIADSAAAQVSAFFDEFAPYIADDVTVDVSNIAVGINEETGAQFAFFGVTGTTRQGEAPQDPLPIGTSAVLSFATNAVVRGRRLAGRVYLAGLDEGVNGPGGLITASILPTVDDIAADTLGGGTSVQVVWSRPVDGGDAGSSSPVTVYSLNRTLSNLKTRRS